MIEEFARRTRAAYFSMEIALRSEIHTYAGGLGILAGDTARSCADLELPVVFITLISRQGYLRQVLDAQGRQSELPDPWAPEQWATPLATKVMVELEGRPVWVRPWLHLLRGLSDYEVPALLLDTGLEENHPEDRAITDRLYGGDAAYRLRQEFVLGVGGLRILHTLGFQVETYHMNEGHSAPLALELLRTSCGTAAARPDLRSCSAEAVRARCVFTTHTPVEAGHDKFPYPLVQRLLDGFVDIEAVKSFAGSDALNMTQLALSLSGYVNGVAERHAALSARMFPGHRIHAIDNGVHASTWTSRSFAELYESHFPAWRHHPEILTRADLLDDADVWSAHVAAKRDLLQLAAQATGTELKPDVMTLGFARRMTGYKRPDLLFSDLPRLAAIARRHPLQIVAAGKAHPADQTGKAMIELIHRAKAALDGTVEVVFLPNYDMDMARVLVAGVDVWVNTPLPPLEASGTSGMKAALNGVLNLSVLDGWWLEACIDGTTGWAVGDTATDRSFDDGDELYAKLEQSVGPTFHDDRSRWIWMMKQAICKIVPIWNSQHMMRRYAAEAYLR